MRSTSRARHWLRPLVAGVAATAALGMALPASASTDPLISKQWGLGLVHAPEAWAVGRGAGVTIAVVDSGADLGHEELASKIVGGRSFVGNSAQDDDGHGTHVSGIAAGIGGNGRGGSGVAPDAKVMPVKVLTPDGGNSGDVADGIRYAADSGAAVINLSLGADVPLVTAFSSTLPDAIRYAWSKGAICVLAAGNNSLPISDYGNLPAIVVTALDRNSQQAGYATSIGGARWGMAAPGGAANGNPDDDVLSTYWVSGKSNSYAYLAGTSMAAPFVSGAAAILRGLGLSPQQTVDRLLSTADDIGASGRDNTFGSGRLDLVRAVQGLGATPATSPPATPAGGGTSATPSANSPTPSRTRPSTTNSALGVTANDTPTTVVDTPITSGDEADSATKRVARKAEPVGSSPRSTNPVVFAGGFVAAMTAATAVALAWRSRRVSA